MIENKVIEILNSFNKKVNIVDIGCHKAGVVSYVKPKLNNSSFWIGADPCNHGVGGFYDKYFELAIDNVDSELEGKFTEYPDEMGCNSLLELNRECITHNLDEYDKKWWIKANIEQREVSRQVKINSLYNILNSINFQDQIHYLKIDTQGNDINVVKSLKTFINQTHYIQIETVTSHNKNITLYKNQNIHEEDVEEMSKLGFSVLYMEDYSINKNACPEANVIFYNKNLVTV
jgi:hypothetical protein